MAGISLRDYQTDAVERMKNGCILCGGVGSGKSRTALAYYYKQNGGEGGHKKLYSDAGYAKRPVHHHHGEKKRYFGMGG
mgnify:CR=1 FL=1